ncbi:MAG: Malto-oligosyltrehalose synthase [Myxococcaceae bacterium]|nr:Malto-oligosyltrehalose synthase [Myxococcaceae bacterium]
MKTITATYRLQLHEHFGFQAARAVVDYLDDLGVSHAYASPYMKAEAGSTHGYNLVDPKALNPELGTERDYLDWTETLASKDMGHIVDFVPNHMAASTHNAWWSDVLENGPSSLYADHFDIEWNPQKEALRNKVLLPVLGAQFGEVLEKGELVLERNGGAFFIRYWERCLPANPRSVWPLLERAVEKLVVPDDDPRRHELASIVTGLRNMPPRTETLPERQRERAREKEILKRRLAALAEDEAVARAIDGEVKLANGVAGDPKSFDELDRILMEQSYRLAFWRVATEEINYRRFFDVNDLAAIRMEDSAVFADTHELLLRLVGEGRVQGVRLDHTDGLYDPSEYFAKLRRSIQNVGEGQQGRREIYLVAEKILMPGEELPQRWAIEGTTGYDFLVQASGVFVDRAAEKAITRVWHELSGDTRSFHEHSRDSKRATMRSSLSSEIHMLSQRLERIAMRDRRSRDFTLPMLHRAVAETIAAFPVYRTYIRPDGTRESHDEHIIRRATRIAQRRNPEVAPSVFELLRDVLLLSHEPLDEEDHAARVQFAMRFQQLTGPVMAKSVEDTAFYTYVRFVALNEVGGAPERFGTTTSELHGGNALRRARWPRTMTATSTHDTKRGEDVRARLAVLSEIPETWAKWAEEWLGLGAAHLTAIEEETAPSIADQYLFFQTALGAYPLCGGTDTFITRLVDYAVKAAREAKQRTSWLAPDEAYEAALKTYITGLFSTEAFETALETAADAIATYGVSNSLGQVVLKLASPGIPDTYQGSELWDLSLVDPDNRMPVDYEERRRALKELDGVSPKELLASYRDGRVKLHVLRAGLRLRREMPKTFLEGDYTPIDAGEDVVAFSRNHAEGSVVCVVTRRPHHVTGGLAPFAIDDVWGHRELPIPRGEWRDALTGATHTVEGDGMPAARLFAQLPVALLVRR